MATTKPKVRQGVTGRAGTGKALAVETWPIERLTANPENYRGHPAAQLEHLQESLRSFGWYKNVVVTPEGMVLAGHGIIAAAKAEGIAEVPVHVFRGTEAEARKLMVADNEAARLAEDDNDQLSQLLESIRADSDAGLTGTGHDDDSLAALLEEVANANPPTGYVQEDEGPGEPPADPVTKPGDVWVMGALGHRVVCGDCTEAGAWEAALQGQKATLLLTDPPYNVGFEYGAGTNDNQSEEKYLEWCSDWWSMAAAASERQALTCGTLNLWVWYAIERPATLGFWHKPASSSRCRIAMFGCIEPIVFWGKGWPLRRHDELFAHSANRPAGAEDHPCPKPVALWVDLLNSYTDKGQTVIDPFLGSGTTLIAAEQLGRVCYGIEIEPRYVDVAVIRWQKLTSQRAILESTGEPFPLSEKS